MRLVAVLVVAAAVFAAGAGADAAVGVRDARLSGIASALVGKPVTVRCASAATLREIAGTDFDPEGVTVFASRTLYLISPVCAVLARVKGRKPPVRTTWAGSSLRTFLHEAWHLRGIRDESDAECRALREIGQVAIQRFKVIKGRWLHDAVAEAWVDHRSLTAEYTRLC